MSAFHLVPTWNDDTRSMLILLSSLIFLAALHVDAQMNTPFSLALFDGGTAFFEPVRQGWNRTCEYGQIQCYVASDVLNRTDSTCYEMRREKFREWISMGISGIAMHPCGNASDMKELIDQARASGVFVTTYDGDIPDSSRSAYIGTDNAFMGRTMAKLLRQLRPEGGTYQLVGIKTERNEGFQIEISRYNNRTDRAHWYELQGDFLLADPPDSDYMALMERAASLNPTAMIFMKQTPMRHENFTNFVDSIRHRGITLIGADGSDYQLEYLNTGYVDGLVGQLPYEMGARSAEVLYHLVNGIPPYREIISTNVVSYNLIPLELPVLNVEKNLVGNLRIVGYLCFGIVIISIVGGLVWTYRNRSSIVVMASQPFFLVMVMIGVLIMSGSLISLTLDDGGNIDSLSETRRVWMCMSVPWLGFMGFTVTYSALFSKLWRVNMLFRNSRHFTRVKVRAIDVLPPFLILLTCNVAVLLTWTIVDPLMYHREENVGTDYWHRIISTYGACRSDHGIEFLTPLGIINLCVLLLASWQAIMARRLKSELSDAKFVGLTIGVFIQAFLTGVPVVFVVRDQPKAYYLILTTTIFLLCESILLLIFIPKIILQREYSNLSKEEQKRRFENAISSGPASTHGNMNNPESSLSVTACRKDNVTSSDMGNFDSSLAPEERRTSSLQEQRLESSADQRYSEHDE